MSSFSSSVTLGTPSRDRALEACSNSDIKTLHSMLSEQGELAGKDDDDLISLFMARAACTGQSKSLEYLFAQYPEFPLKQNSLGTVHNNIFYGQNALPIYKLLVERYPFLREWDLGEVADHLGSATMVNDLEFATYLLEVERVDASKARFFNRPILRLLRMAKSKRVSQ
ncbi:hypothetical protein EJ08DRAFT_653361 [Tothia fuscella]|uniref:Uncharacterized protein n=1 Tax=Tothia fuscella TaxID=1048955 RepID=A0A9P4NHW7_9PEZI|nr:hypothetical protein EJ08DRAFT_653361 [Tothia fuscella]